MADIIQISEARFERVHKGVCFHNNLCYDEMNEYVECKDCGRPVSPFQAFMVIMRAYRRGYELLKAKEQELNELENRGDLYLLKATRKIDHVWRSKRVVPLCPHCKEGILPEDGLGDECGSRPLIMERRRFKKP